MQPRECENSKTEQFMRLPVVDDIMEDDRITSIRCMWFQSRF